MANQNISCEEAAKLLKNCTEAHILIHQNPDGDCIGSGYALAQMLWQLGKKASVLCSDPIPKRYQFMLPEDEELHRSDCPDLIVSVDVADEKLVGDSLTDYKGNIQLAIDHHHFHRAFAPKILLDEFAAAACQVVYKLLEPMGVTLTASIAKCLYTGIATDTGGFLFDNVSPSTLRILADIREQQPDLPYSRYNRDLFLTKNKKRLEIESLLAKLMEEHFNGKCYFLAVSMQTCEENHLAAEDFDGFAGFPLQLEGTEIGILMREKEPDVWKISLRSANDANVCSICQLFGGGGHIKAAGCQMEGSLDTVRTQLLAAVRKELNRI